MAVARAPDGHRARVDHPHALRDIRAVRVPEGQWRSPRARAQLGGGSAWAPCREDVLVDHRQRPVKASRGRPPHVTERARWRLSHCAVSSRERALGPPPRGARGRALVGCPDANHRVRQWSSSTTRSPSSPGPPVSPGETTRSGPAAFEHIERARERASVGGRSEITPTSCTTSIPEGTIRQTLRRAGQVVNAWEARGGALGSTRRPRRTTARVDLQKRTGPSSRNDRERVVAEEARPAGADSPTQRLLRPPRASRPPATRASARRPRRASTRQYRARASAKSRRTTAIPQVRGGRDRPQKPKARPRAGCRGRHTRANANARPAREQRPSAPCVASRLSRPGRGRGGRRRQRAVSASHRTNAGVLRCGRSGRWTGPPRRDRRRRSGGVEAPSRGETTTT